MTDEKRVYIEGLRDLADYLETSEIELGYEYRTGIRLDVFTYSEAMFAEQQRKLGGFREKVLEGSYAIVRRTFGPHAIEVNISRDKVCERVEVGERVVPATDEHVEKVYEWKCPEGFTASGTPILTEVPA
jgi:hypothetical protein